MKKKFHYIKMTLLGLVLFCCAMAVYAQSSNSYPAWCKTTTSLNIRATDNRHGRKITTVNKGTRLKVIRIGGNGWAQIDLEGQTAYCAARYLTYVEPVKIENNATSITNTIESNSFSWETWGKYLLWAFYIVVICIALAILRKIILFVLGILSKLFYKLSLVSLKIVKSQN